MVYLCCREFLIYRDFYPGLLLILLLKTRTLARTQAIVTQLVFEHSLRIRVKAEAADSSESSTSSSSETLTPDSASLCEASLDGSLTLHSVDPTEAESGLVHSSASSVSSVKSKSKKGKKEKQDDPPQSDANNLVGKINNLVTTDLDNIVDGRDFLFIVLYIPVQIVLCMIFLYILLGWSSFVGLAVMIVSFPLPGYIARKVQIFQEKRLKKTDARVQSVSECMSRFFFAPPSGQLIATSSNERSADDQTIWLGM